MKLKKVLQKAFGINEYGFPDFPIKISNIKIARVEFGEEMGCSRCFPHGFETTNSSIGKNNRSWKYSRKKQWLKPK